MPPASFSEIILYNLLTSVFSFSFEKGNSINSCSLWGGRVVRLPVLGRPIIWIVVGQGPSALAIGAGVVWTFSFLFFLSVSGRQPDID